MADGPTSYAHLTFNAPLSDARSDQLSRRLAGARPSTIVDVGCGWGELVNPGGRLLLGEGFWEPTGPVDRGLAWDDVRPG